MIKTNKRDYSTLAILLLERVGDDDFFSGSISYETGSVEYQFISTLILYRESQMEYSPWENNIVNIVPVWWEFNTSIDGEKRLNDFDFDTLREIVCQG